MRMARLILRFPNRTISPPWSGKGGDKMRRTCLTAAVALVMCVSGIRSALTKETFWKVASGNWSVGSNWTQGEPTDSDDAYEMAPV